MTKKQVQIGSVYSAKVSGKLARVRLVAESKHGGWDATNMDTGKPVRIKSAQRLRRCLDAKEQPAAKPKAKIMSKAEYEGTPAVAAKKDVAATVDAVEKGNLAEGVTVPTKKARKPKAAVEKTPRKPSGLDLAAKVLQAAGTPMTAQEISDGAIKAGWQTNGKTPHATLYAAIIREIAAKGAKSRFRKTERGKFESTGVTAEA